MFRRADIEVFVAFVKVFYAARGMRSRLHLLRLFFFTLWKRALGRRSFMQPFVVCLATSYGDARLTIRDMADITTLCAIFVEGEYEVARPPEAVQTVLDLGSNIGASVVYFRLRYPTARIYAVEADPTTFERLKNNCGAMRGVELVHAAISNKTGPLEFHSNESSVSGSLYRREGGEATTRVQGFTIDDLAAEHGIGTVDVLKFDIEGAEFDALPASPRTLREARLVLGEVHPDIGNRPIKPLLDLFDGYEVATEPREKERFILKARRTVNAR